MSRKYEKYHELWPFFRLVKIEEVHGVGLSQNYKKSLFGET